MTDEEQRLSQAAATLWEKFHALWRTNPVELAKLNLTNVDGDSFWSGSYAAGEFHAGADVTLTRGDGAQFLWTVGLLFESSDQVGGRWERGAAYSYVAVLPASEGGKGAYRPIYNIGNVDPKCQSSPCLQLSNLPVFAAGIVSLSEACLQDLEFVLRHNLFERLHSLSKEIKEALPSNPFKEFPHA